MYLCVFTILVVVFQQVNSKKILNDFEKDINRSRVETKRLRDSLNLLNDKVFNLSHFNFLYNDPAKDYYINSFKPDELESLISNALMQSNTYKGNQHPFIPYASMSDSKMLINTIQLINHRWVITDFTDGKYWGELLLKFYINPDKSVDFEVIDHLLYH